MKITAVLDSVFAASSADSFYDDLYGEPNEYSRASHWENIPTDSQYHADAGFPGRYHVTPQEHTTLHNWHGQQGERVEFQPEAPDPEHPEHGLWSGYYWVTHHAPDGSTWEHSILPPRSYDTGKSGLDLNNDQWRHGYRHFDADDKTISSYITQNHRPQPEADSVDKILDNINRLHGGEHSLSVYPYREGGY